MLQATAWWVDRRAKRNNAERGGMYGLLVDVALGMCLSDRSDVSIGVLLNTS